MSVWQQIKTLIEQVPDTFIKIWDGALTSLKLDNESRKQMAFTIGVIALSAKMAVADGVVTNDEVKAFYQIAHINDRDMIYVQRLYELFNQDVTGFEAYAAKIGKYFKDEPETRYDLIDALFHIAKADGFIHQNELVFLHSVALNLGLSDTDFATAKARHIITEEFDPYIVLGVDHNASAQEIRQAYVKIIKQQHPDKLQARGVGQEFINIANEKTAIVNRAYNILKAR